MRPIGFSTGALAKGNFTRALRLLRDFGVKAVELSALRVSELNPIAVALPEIDLSAFEFISVHSPSYFDRNMETCIIDTLVQLRPAFPVVVHPDVIFSPRLWSKLGSRLLIENMDKRKPIGRNVSELASLFKELPDAGFCFDVGHARQVDPSMTEAVLLLQAFGHKLVQVHISEVNTSSRHDPISVSAVRAFQPLAIYIPESVPIIIESLIDEGQSDLTTEWRSAQEALGEKPPVLEFAGG